MSRLLPLLAADDLGFTPSNYMPALKVEVAFTSGYNTAAADRVWTDVSEWVELADGISVDHGRQDERSTADANQVTLTLDNTDGRFTAGRSASPYYPNVKIGRPVRVSAMTVTGYTSVRFVGFIDEWPVEWDGTDAYARASVRATSRLARLGLSTKLRSMIEETILSYAPACYYTMGDPAGSTTAADSTGTSFAPLRIDTSSPGVAAPEFGSGTGPGTDGLTAVQFPADSYRLERTDAPAALSYVATFNIAAPGSTVYLLRILGRTVSFWVLSVEVSTGGVLLLKDLSGTTLITGPTVTDGSTHFVALTLSAGTAYLYLDGALVGSSAVSTPTPPDRLWVGGVVGSPGMTVSHVAAFMATLTAGQVEELSTAVLTGFEGDTTDERLTRILGWAGVAASEIDTDAGAETMTYQQTSGQSVTDALRDVESTESGVLFDGRDGRVTFHTRSRRYAATPAATLDMAAQHVGADYAPKLDRSTLVNDVTVDNPTTGETARSVDSSSVAEYGTVTSSAKSVADSYGQMQQKATWLIASYAEPRPRVPSLTVDVLAHVGLTPSTETLLGLGVGDLIEVVNQPTQADATTAQYFIEGYSETIGPESYSITFNLSPSHPNLSTLVLDSATRGLLDTGILAL